MTTYCVVCRGPGAARTQNPSTIRYYMSAASADRAVAAAAQENPQFRVLGIEPGNPIAGNPIAVTRESPHDAWVA
jgi:hypothetical protein